MKIESFRKEKGLEPILEEAAHGSIDHVTPPIVHDRSSRNFSRIERFVYSSVGSVCVLIVVFAMNVTGLGLNTFGNKITLFVLIGYSIRLIILVVLSGVLGLMLIPTQSPRSSFILLGVSLTLFITTLGQISSSDESGRSYSAPSVEISP